MTNKCYKRKTDTVPVIELTTKFSIGLWLAFIVSVAIVIGVSMWILLKVIPNIGVEETKNPTGQPPEVSVLLNPSQPVQAEMIRTGCLKFTDTYRGSRIDNDYYRLLKENCETEEVLELVIAISVAESGMGRDLPHRHSNFWGWFKGGDRNYDPSREEMAEVICKGIGNYYKGVNTNYDMASRYVGYDPSDWLNRVNWALGQM